MAPVADVHAEGVIQLDKNNARVAETFVEAETQSLDLGTIRQGGAPMYVPIRVVNKGTEPVKLIWMKTDDKNSLIVDAPENMNLEAATAAVFYVAVNPYASVGAYNTSLVVTASDDYAFSSGTEIEITYNMVKPITVDAPEAESEEEQTAEAGGEDDKVDITVKSVPAEASLVAGGGQFDKGSQYKIFVAPKPGYDFEGWYCNGELQGKSFLVMEKNARTDKNYEARFARSDSVVNVKVNHEAAGSVMGAGNVEFGGDVLLKAQTCEGYKFVGWYENGRLLSTAVEYTLTGVNEDRSLVAGFAPAKTDVVVGSDEDGGEVTGEGRINEGGSVALHAEDGKSSKFSGWYKNGEIVSADPDYSEGNFTGDVCFVARFDDKRFKRYDLGVDTGIKNGHITGTADGKIQSGETYTFAIIPDPGYKVKDVILDDNSLGGTNRLTLVAVSGNHRISAQFEEAGVPVTDSDSEDDTVVDMAAEPGLELIYDNAFKSVGTVAEADSETVTEADNEAETEEAGDKVSADAEAAVGDISAEEKLKEQVIEGILNDAEREILSSGGSIKAAVSILDNASNVTKAEKEEMDVFIDNNMIIGNFFDIIILKQSEGVTSFVDTSSKPLTFTVELANSLKVFNREYVVVKAMKQEDGTMDFKVCKDEDQNSDTITFSTDEFGSYAICYLTSNKPDKTGKTVAMLIAFTVIMLVLLVVNIMLIKQSHKKKKN